MDLPEPIRGAADRALPKRAWKPAAATEAYALLAVTMVCWGGNAVAGRLAVGEVSPMVIISLRWAIVALFLGGVTSRGLLLAWPELRRHWRRVALMAVCGFSAFNALFYVAAHYTTAVNISILQGAVPILVVLGALVLHRTRVGAIQTVGIAATLIGVAVVATHGHIATLADLSFNRGDAMMLVACVLYAGYTLSLRNRPMIPSLVFFAAMAVVAFLTSLPLLAYEVVTATVQWPTPKGWAIVAFIAIFPSFLAQLAFMRGVQLIGLGRAGLFANLVPLFGAFLAVAILGEPLALFHLVGLVLVIGGILAAETAGRIHADATARKAIGGDRRRSPVTSARRLRSTPMPRTPGDPGLGAFADLVARAMVTGSENRGSIVNVAEDIRRIALQEERLRFETFGPETVWALGTWLREAAIKRRAPIAIDVQTYGMPLFFCAMPGSTPDNVDWIRRKRNLVLRMCASSYGIGLKLAERETTLQAQMELPLRDYASHGGGFPVLLEKGTCIGAITVSGLPQREDHNLVVEAIAAVQKRNLSDVALQPE